MDYEVLYRVFIESIGLNKNHLETFLSISHSRTLTKNENLIKEGTVCNVIAFITAGLMRSFVRGNGEEYNTDFYFNNYFVSAYSSMVTQLPTEHVIQALTETKVKYITLDQYNELISIDPQWLRFGKYIADFFLIRKCKREISFLKLSASRRMEDMLKTYPGIEQLVSQYHIASYLGIKPESLSRLKLIEASAYK